MDCVVLNESTPVGSTHENISAVNASELYGHAEKTILLLLIISGECILVQDDGRYVVFTAWPYKFREFSLNGRHEIGFSLREFRPVHMIQDLQSLSIRLSFRLVDRIDLDGPSGRRSCLNVPPRACDVTQTSNTKFD